MNGLSMRMVLAVLLVTTMTSLVSAGSKLELKDRVLEELFPSTVGSEPYFVTVIARFKDSDTQLTITVYPGRKSEIIQYRLAGMERGDLSKLIGRLHAENPDVTVREISDEVKVETSRMSVEYRVVEQLLDELKGVRISPALASRVSVGQASAYEFWYYTGQESVHYRIKGKMESAPQGKLVQWMMRLRNRMSDVLKASQPSN